MSGFAETLITIYLSNKEELPQDIFLGDFRINFHRFLTENVH